MAGAPGSASPPPSKRLVKEYLSGVDILFGGLGSPNFPYLAGVAVGIYDPPEAQNMTLDSIKALLKSKRIRFDRPDRARFYSRLVREGDPNEWLRRPYFVNDNEFRMEDHVVEVTLPAPGTDAQLRELAAEILATPLDENKPLWKFYLVKGLSGGRVATVDRNHHAISDGEGMVRSLFVDEASASSQYRLRHRESHNAVVALLSAAWAYLVGLLTLVAFALFVNPRLVGARRSLRISGADAERHALRELGVRDTHARKQVYYSTDGVLLADVKAMKDALGVSLNDCVLGLAGRAIDRYLREKGAMRDERMSFGVPASMRSPTDTSLSNKVLAFNVVFPRSDPAAKEPLPTVEYIHQTSEWMDWQKTLLPMAALQMNLFKTLLVNPRVLPMGLTESLMAPSFGGISNVPGPAEPLKWGPAPISRLYVTNPIPAATPGTLGIAVLSYAGRLYFCIAMDLAEGDEERLGDNRVYAKGAAERITTLFEAEIESLKAVIEKSKESGTSLRRKPNARLFAHVSEVLKNGLLRGGFPLWILGVGVAVAAVLTNESLKPKKVRVTVGANGELVYHDN